MINLYSINIKNIKFKNHNKINNIYDLNFILLLNNLILLKRIKIQ